MAKEQISVKLPPILAEFLNEIEEKYGGKTGIIVHALYKMMFEYEKELEEKERIKRMMTEILTEDETLLKDVIAKIAPKLSKETKKFIIEALK